MSKYSRVAMQPNLLTWARARAGLSLDALGKICATVLIFASLFENRWSNKTRQNQFSASIRWQTRLRQVRKAMPIRENARFVLRGSA